MDRIILDLLRAFFSIFNAFGSFSIGSPRSFRRGRRIGGSWNQQARFYRDAF